MNHDIEQARHFLKLLDEEAEEFTFQTFDDKPKKDPKAPDKLAKWLHGSIDSLFETLVNYNNSGAGVFVMVQAGDGSGRNIKAVQKIRCVFNENDHGVPKQMPLEPHIVVESSPGRAHYYFLCDGLGISEFKPIEARLIADYGSDPNATDLARVMRLPGFFHNKTAPHLVHITHESGAQAYHRDSIITAFPPYLNGHKKEYANDYVKVDTELVKDLRSALLFMRADEYAHWINMGLALKALGTIGRGLWLEWSSTCLDKFNASEAADKWETFKPDNIGFKSVFTAAKAQGWINPKSGSNSLKDDYISRFDEAIYNSKKSIFNEILDTENKYHKTSIANFVDDKHLLKRLSLHVSEQTHLPINTVFLMGLAVFSSMASRCYTVAYENGVRLPIGIYAVAEQPPGSAKSWCLSEFQKPFFDIYKNTVVSELTVKPMLFVTNATPEGLESTLIHTKGHFSAISSEQGLFNSLFGASYTQIGKAHNNDISLNGFDGGYISSQRVGREGYMGRACGSIACFAQPGSIESVLSSSNGTGLSERFLMLSEKHNLGTRDHTKARIYDIELKEEYIAACRFIETAIIEAKYIDDLICLEISSEGFEYIHGYQNHIEPYLADGEKYSNAALRGAAGKIDIQIMKIAANLHLLESGGTFFNRTIDITHIKTALLIANGFIESNLVVLREKGILGVKAEFEAIINYLTAKHGAKSERDIQNSLRATKPFKEISGNKHDAIKQSLEEMTLQGVLEAVIDSKGKKSYLLAQ